MAGQDYRPLMAALLRAFGVAATVTRPAPDDEPIVTEGIWVPLGTMDMPEGGDWQRIEGLRCLAFDVDAVPTLPRGTLIDAPERKGGTVRTWIVDGAAQPHGIDADQVKVIVRLNREPET